jgi:hypothetical protein
VDAARRVEGPAEEQSQLVAAARSVEAQGGAVVEISLAAVASASLARATSDEERALVRAKMIEPPLGWSLSRAVRDAMDRVLDERGGGLDREMGVLEAALAGHAAKNERCNAR